MLTRAKSYNIIFNCVTVFLNVHAKSPGRTFEI